VMIASGGMIASSEALSNESLPNLFPFPNARGLLETYNVTNRPIDLTGPFFQSLGTNGRSCGSCHRPAQAWTVSPPELKLRFEQTQGRDPIFRTNDARRFPELLSPLPTCKQKPTAIMLASTTLFFTYSAQSLMAAERCSASSEDKVLEFVRKMVAIRFKNCIRPVTDNRRHEASSGPREAEDRTQHHRRVKARAGAIVERQQRNSLCYSGRDPARPGC
jgi:hypothetical protein